MMDIPPGAIAVTPNSIKNPSLFWASEKICPGMSDNARKLQALEVALSKSFRNKPEEFSVPREEDEYVAVMSKDREAIWHRGKIVHAFHQLNGIKYRVSLIDYGEQVQAKPSHLRSLPRIYIESLPPQAMLLQLYGIVPLTLEVDFVHDKTSHGIAENWIPAAEKFVCDVFKSYLEAYFVEKEDSPFRESACNILYGDVLVRMDSVERGASSLSEMLCAKMFAMRNEMVFLKRQQALFSDVVDRPVACHFSSTVDSDGKSPPGGEPSTHQGASRSMDEYIVERNAQKQMTASTSSEDYVLEENTKKQMSDSSTSKQLETLKSESGRARSFSSLLERLKTGSAKFSPSASGEESLEECESQSTPVQHAARPVLGDSKITFLPAGRSVTGPEKKSRRNTKSTPVQEKHSLDSDSSQNTESTPLEEEQEHPHSLGSDSSICTKSMPVREKQEYPQSLGSDSSRNRSGSGSWSDTSASSSRSLLVSSEMPLPKPNERTSCEPDKAPPLHKKSRLSKPSLREDVVSEEIYLTRRVLIHGGLPPNPWITKADFNSKFTEHMERVVNKKKWSYNILTLEKYVWPAILSRQNVVMVSGPKTGKTTGYMVPLMDFMFDIEAPKGNGPVVVILCGGCKAAEKVYLDCIGLTSDSKTKVRIRLAYGLVLDEDFMVDMINGCEVLVTTPCCLLRIMGMQSIIMNLHRLRHLVIDQADILFVKFLEEMRVIQARVHVELTRRDGDPIQCVVSSEKWVPHLLSFTSHIKGNPPLVCINDCYEAVVYGKAHVVLHRINSQQKPSYLIELLNKSGHLGVSKLVVFCNDETEINLLENFFKNACLSFLVMKPSSSHVDLEATFHSWDVSCDGQHHVLLCTDSEFCNSHIRDAMCIVHYSLPTKDRSVFVHRLSAVLNNLQSMFDKERCPNPPEIHTFVDENNSDQLPAITMLIQRLGIDVHPEAKDLAKNASKKKEENKRDKPLCSSLKMFGDCWDKSSCPSRHVLISDLDNPIGLPTSGTITMKILHVHNACHFSARLLEHVSDNGFSQRWPSNYFQIALKMTDYFSIDSNKIIPPEVSIGDICAIETLENLFQRVQILEITKKDKRDKPEELRVQFLDEGHIVSVKVYLLYFLPENLRLPPAQAIDIYICQLLPCDKDENWSDLANKVVQKWIKAESDKDETKVFKGQIALSMRGALWVNPFNVMMWLPHSKTYVCVRNIRRSLLEGQYAFDNPGHIQKMYSLCKGGGFVLPSSATTERCAPRRPQNQPKPAWAFLEEEDYNSIIFSAADSVQCLFVRRKKFDSLLQIMVKDIGEEIERKKNKEIPVLEPGCICLARDTVDHIWNRAQVLQVKGESIDVFYVDHGDRETVPRQDVTSISDWAITRLPFQAIECSLAGISSCDSIDTLYDILDDGAKRLLAKVCEKRDPSDCTGGRHFVVTIVDCSAANPSVLNKDLLQYGGVHPLKEQSEYIEIDSTRRLLSDFSDLETESSDSHSKVPLDEMAFEPSYLEGADCQPSPGSEVIAEIPDEDAYIELNGYRVYDKDWDEEPLLEFFKDLQREKPEPEPLMALKGIEAAPTKPRELSEREENDRFVMPTLCSARPPQVKWYEDLYYVWIKMCVTGVSRYFLRWNASRIQFSTSVSGRNYHFDQELRGAFYPECLVSTVSGFWVTIKLKKACSGVAWERLLKSKRRYVWLSMDYDFKAVSSDDSDTNICPSIQSINREIKKLPMQQRRRRRKQEDGPALPDDSDWNSDSSADADLMDPDFII